MSLYANLSSKCYCPKKGMQELESIIVVWYIIFYFYILYDLVAV